MYIIVIMDHSMSSYRTRYGTFHYVICLLPELYRRMHCVCTRKLHHAMLVPGDSYCSANYSTTRRAYLCYFVPLSIAPLSVCIHLSPCRRTRHAHPHVQRAFTLINMPTPNTRILTYSTT